MKKRPHPPSAGHLHFVTVITHGRIPLFRSSVLCQEFFAALKEVKARFPFELYAYVLLPDHLHLLLRPNDGDISHLMQKIKSLAARKLLASFQDSFRDLELWSPWMIRQKIDYIHTNPVNERLADNAAAYSWSSWRAINEHSQEPLAVDPLP